VSQTAPEYPDAIAVPPAAAHTAASAVVETLTNELEALTLNRRYAFLLDQGANLQASVLIEFIRRLHATTAGK